jgi:phospholipase C
MPSMLRRRAGNGLRRRARQAALDRREFLRRTAQLGGAVALGGPVLGFGRPGASGRPAVEDFTSMLDQPAKESPIDTVVVVMMENRSFDHYFGWLADDKKYIERGRSRYGKRFHVDGEQRQAFPAPDGSTVQTAPLLANPGEANPYRGCGHPDPGHQWTQGRAQRDGGFLAPGSGNDAFALGYYGGDALPFTSQLAREFTVFDRWHASVLGPTYPNRAYLHSAQSGTYKTNVLPFATGGYEWETIWERLAKAGVSAGYYYTDLPVLALWGSRLANFQRRIEQYFTDAQQGTLPKVTMVDPAFLSGNRTDDHPHADIRAGQRFLRDVFSAFARSKHWRRGAFVVMYDEWGGFYDHVKPPMLPDDRANPVDDENYGQAGFRVPALIASPYARRGYVDHTLYDHTSVLRFLEWRFLGAPARGPGKAGQTWFLTTRDRRANNLGASLATERVDRRVGINLDVALADPSPPCDAVPGAGGGMAVRLPARVAAPEQHALEQAYEAGWFERVGHTVKPSPMAKEWARG